MLIFPHKNIENYQIHPSQFRKMMKQPDSPVMNSFRDSHLCYGKSASGITAIIQKIPGSQQNNFAFKQEMKLQQHLKKPVKEEYKLSIMDEDDHENLNYRQNSS